jgi:hypothetical protein
MNVKDAVDVAVSYVRNFSGLLAQDITLEETEFDDASGYWLVTLGLREHPLTASRSYKQFVIDEKGNVLSMKVRNVLGIN